MKLRCSALSILVTFVAASFFAAALAPQLRLTPAAPVAPARSESHVEQAIPTTAVAAEGEEPCICEEAKRDQRAAILSAPTATPLPTATPKPTATPRPTVTPTPEPVTSRSIFVDQDAQVMHVYENGKEIRTMPCSTGLPTPNTLTPAWSGRVGVYAGTFFAFGTYQDEGWFLFDDFLIHSAPYTLEGETKVYHEMDALGRRPVSHGCIRLHPDDARWLTEWNPLGVPMAISPLTRSFD